MGDLHALREPFPDAMVGKLPKGGVALDYVGHGAVTSRLLEVDPEWNWEPLALDEQGLPRFTVDAQGNPIALWIRLTVLGLTRLGCGTCSSKQNDAEKVLIGDAIRNAAMRFGVALDLWIKGHGEDDEARTNGANNAPARRQDAPPPGPVPISDENRAKFLAQCEANGLDADDIAAVVHDATDGRTSAPAEVLTSEVAALRDAFKARAASFEPGSSGSADAA